MRIISKEKDYYDRYGTFDKNDNVWIRKIKKNDLDDYSNPTSLKVKKDIDDFIVKSNLISCAILPLKDEIPSGFLNTELSFGYISFCGSLKPFVRVSNVNSIENNSFSHVFYDIDTFKRFCHKQKLTNAINCSIRLSCIFFNNSNFLSKNKIIYKVSSFLKQRVDLEDLNQLFLSPIVVIENNSVVSDATLKNYDFIKLFTPDICFQSIEMYINNNLLTIDSREEFSDLDKIVSHGFDKKTSFRKSKIKK